MNDKECFVNTSKDRCVVPRPGQLASNDAAAAATKCEAMIHQVVHPNTEQHIDVLPASYPRLYNDIRIFRASDGEQEKILLNNVLLRSGG